MIKTLELKCSVARIFALTLIAVFIVNIGYSQMWDEGYTDYTWDYEKITGKTYQQEEVGTYRSSVPDTVDSNLKVLVLYSCDKLPSNIWELKKLEVLEIAECKFTWEDLKGIKHLKNLIYLDLYRFNNPKEKNSKGYLQHPEGYSSTICSELFELSKLKYLQLYGNYINELPSEMIGWKSIERLHVVDQWPPNGLKVAPEIGQLTTLKILNLSRCDMSTLPTELFNLTKLESLCLGTNRLDLHAYNWAKLSGLVELEVCGNSYNIDDPKLPESIFSMASLKRFYYPSGGMLNVNKAYVKQIKTNMPKVRTIKIR